MDNFCLSVPKVTKRNLLFVAGMVWTFAGIMLIMKGFAMAGGSYNVYKIFFSLLGGAIFYSMLFSKISLKHVDRIKNMENETPGLFSFFSLKSYLLMVIMISSGIFLRTSGIINPEYLSLFYIIMGTPLLISAFRFYYNGIVYTTVKKTC